MKKIRFLSIFSFLIFLCGFAKGTVALNASEFQIRVMPTYTYFMNGIGDISVGGSASLDFAPLTLRANDKLLISAQGTFINLFEKGIKSERYIDYGISLGYSARISDRFYINPEAIGGIWSITENKENNLPYERGFFYGGRLSFDIHILPELYVSLFGGYKSLQLINRFFAHTVHGGIGFTYNFTKGMRYSSNLQVSETDLSPLFPVFYAHYADNPFGTITLVNNEEAAITDVHIYFYNEQYMLVRTLVASYNKIKQGQAIEVSITALLNENILTQLSDSVTTGQLTVEYKLLNKSKDYTETLSFTTLSRNSMTWEDDRQAAAFVSPRDSCAQKFARQVKSIVKSSLSSDIPQNIQYAGALFCALKDYGINYVIDPTSAYSDNTGGLTIDFLQFPYQTLSYHGGDCDDLSIMNCSLLEAIGIKTAFITIPGHIYIAFDSGVSVEDAAKLIPGQRYVVKEDRVWIPYEITLCTDTFDLALRTGYTQWIKAGEEAVLIPLEDAWTAFKAVSVPESDTSIQMPDRDQLIYNFKKLQY